MDIAVRSYLIAGVATVGVGTAALSPVAPIPDGVIPTLAAPTQLTGAASFIVENTKIFVDGWGESFQAAGALAVFGIAPALLDLPSGVIAAAKDNQLPTFAEEQFSGFVTVATACFTFMSPWVAPAGRMRQAWAP